jgi:hypothetical protein
MDIAHLPGGDLVERGIADLRARVVSIASLLVSQAPGALDEVGIAVPDPWPEPEDGLYAVLDREYGDGAHSKYNAYRRQLASFLRAARCAAR